MNPIETYVQAVTAQIHFFLDRGRIGDELRAHLQDSAEDLMQEEGLTPEQAQAEAAAPALPQYLPPAFCRGSRTEPGRECYLYPPVR